MPLRGIFHAAGVINDQPFTEITPDDLATVLAPKLEGARNLDQATRDNEIELDIFILYSSISAATGTVPQTSYAAANTTLDSLAAWRRAHGLAATSVNWGAMSGGGMAETSAAVTKYLELLGFKPMDLDYGAALMLESTRFNLPNIVLADVDWPTWRSSTKVAAQSVRFTHLTGETAAASQNSAVRNALLEMPPEERGPAVTKVIVQQLSEVLGVEPDSIDTRGPLVDLGIDSVMAVEFGARVQKQLDIQITMFQFTGDLTLEAIGTRVAKLLSQQQP